MDSTDYIVIVEYIALNDRHLRIPYKHEGFSSHTIEEGQDVLCVTWDDILWSAITLGRPSWDHVLQHGMSSINEIHFRLSLVNMALESRGDTLYRSKAVTHLDPTEKGMINYFIGMIFCKLFSTMLLDTPWLMHLDVWRHELDIKVSGSLRPDLVGEDSITKRWSVFESKGRARPPSKHVKKNAKEQTKGVISVMGSSCSLRVAAITYYVGDALNFYWSDPPPSEDESDHIELPYIDNLWQHYYSLVAGLITPAFEVGIRRRIDDASGHWYVSIEQWDIEVVVHGLVAGPLLRRDWHLARSNALEVAEELARDGFHADGISVRAGDSWYQAGGEGTTSAGAE